MTNSFALNRDKSLQIYVFCVKRQAKNDFLKDVESTVDQCLHYSLTEPLDIVYAVTYSKGVDQTG